MTDFDLLELIGEADDRYIMESRKRPKKKPALRRWTPVALAAVLALAVMGGAWAITLQNGVRGKSHAASQDDGVTMEAAAEAEEWATDVPVETVAEAAEPMGVTLLAAAEYPQAIGYDDYETARENWQENQTSDETKTALNAFAYSTAARVLRDRTESGCYSPLSLYQTLAVLASGAEGQTRDQLLSLLGQSDLQTLSDQAGKLYRVNYADDGINILKIANSLWLDEDDTQGNQVAYHQDWVLSAAADYYADVYAAEFASEDTSLALGNWIAEKTGGMLHPDPETLDLDPNTVMAIVNTLWYKTQWMEPFQKGDTKPGDFTTANGDTVTCDFMHRTETGGSVIQTAEYTKSALNLDRGRMIFVLPNEGVDVDDLLTEETLWEIFENGDYSSANVVWSVPKFETGVTYQLEDALKDLGITDAFDPAAADFSAISDTPLYVGQVQQGTHIAVTEDGVEAAAYTVAAELAGEGFAGELPTVEMDLNRPFLYLITANDGSTLFMGVVRDPAN